MLPIFQKSRNLQFTPNHCTVFPKTIHSNVSKFNWQWYNPPADSAPATFCRSTSLHGLRYVGEQNRHICERIFWLGAFSASACLAVQLIWVMWRDYTVMPIVTVFNPTEKGLDEIPFPAVTVCNVNLVQKSMHDWLYALIMAKTTQQANQGGIADNFKWSAKLVDLSLICDSLTTYMDTFVPNPNRKLFRDSWTMSGQHFEEFGKHLDPIATIINVSQPCSRMISNCIWQNHIHDCSKLFQPILTDYGVCCTFNSMPRIASSNHIDSGNSASEMDWDVYNLDSDSLMFTEGTKNRKYPFRQGSVGKQNGLSFLLEPDLDEYLCTNTDSEGFVVGINSAIDYPRMLDNSFAIGTNSEFFVGIRPEITISDNSVKSLAAAKRNCYYAGEYSLRYYSVYTYTNCMSECVTIQTLEQCGCVRYNMPHSTGDKLCRPQFYNCTEEVERNIGSLNLLSLCKACLPSCTEIEYQKEITGQRLQPKKVDKLLKEYSESNFSKDVSVVHIFFYTDAVYPKLRKELTTPYQLISSAGGLLGLCLGFSLLSLLEIVYYATMRACCNCYRERSLRNECGGRISINHIAVSCEKSNEDKSYYNSSTKWKQ